MYSRGMMASHLFRDKRSSLQVLDLPSDHARGLMRGLHEQQKAQQFCDVTVCVGEKKFLAHKNVLSAACKYFHVMFLGDLSEATQGEVHLQEIRPVIFEMLLNYIYSGELVVEDIFCQDLLAVADMLGLDGAVAACCDHLKLQLHPSNCLGIYRLAELHSCDDLSGEVKNYIFLHFLDILKEEEFSELSKELLINILSSESLHIDSEIQVLNAGLQWICHNIQERRVTVFQVLSSIRFPLIPYHDLMDAINNCSDLSLKIALRKIIQDFDLTDFCSPRMRKIFEKQPQLFQTRRGGRRNILVIGGYKQDEGDRYGEGITLDTCTMYNLYAETSKTLPSMQYERVAHSAVLLEGCVYVIGGENESLIYDDMEFYNLSTEQWSVAPGLLQARTSHAAVTLDHKIYLFGGWIGSDITKSIDIYDPELKEWREMGKMKYPLVSMGAVAYEGLIYLVGGWNHYSDEMGLIEAYNPVTGLWSEGLSRMHIERSHLSVCAGGGCIYVVGGYGCEPCTGACTVLSSVEKYDIKKNEWTVLEDMPEPRAEAGSAFINQCLYVFGGRTGKLSDSATSTHSLDTVIMYDPGRKMWLPVDIKLNHGHSGAAVVIL